MASAVIPLRQSAVDAALKQAAFEAFAFPAVCLNAAGQMLAANSAFSALVDSESLVGRHVSDLIAAPGPVALRRRWDRVWTRLQTSGRFVGRAKLRLVNGSRRVVELTVSRVEVDGERVAAVALRDIAEERAGARAQRAKHLREALLARAGSEFGFLIGPDRRVIAVNPAAEGIVGGNASDLLGVPFEYLLDDVSSIAFRDTFDVLLRSPSKSGSTALRFSWRLRATSSSDGRKLDAALVNRLNDPLVRALAIHARDAASDDETRATVERLRRRAELLAEGSADVLMVLDSAGIVRFQSPAIFRVLGIIPESTVGRAGHTLVIEEDRTILRSVIQAAALDTANEQPHMCLVRARDGSGGIHRLWMSVRNYLSEPATAGLLVTARDVTQPLQSRPVDAAQQARRLEFRERLLELAIQTRAEFPQSLARVLQAVAETLKASAAGFWRHLPSPGALRCESLFDRHAADFDATWLGVELPPDVYPAYFAQLRERQPIVVEDVQSSPLLQGLHGHVRWRKVAASLDAPVLLDGEVQGVLCVYANAPRTWDEDEVNFAAQAALMISLAMEAAQRQEAETRIEQLAWYDPLTGLPNRNLLRETMRDMIMTAGNRHRRLAVILVDLDRFKDVNDTHGHVIGDALIRAAGEVLRELIGDAGMVARLGGDEFVVLLHDFEHRQEVALLAARLTQTLNRSDLVANVETQVSASIGVALFPEHGRDMGTLLKNADSAVYQAKRDGRNQFSFFNPIRYERASREVQLGIQLLKAVQADRAEFFIEYQPQIEMATDRVVGFEALIRWMHPAYGRLTPDRFIGVAEVSGLSERITRWVFNEVCAQIVRWRKERPGFNLPVAVNVAGREMSSAALPMLVRNTLQKHGVEPAMIVMEITERTLVKEGEVNNDVMAELANLGIGLSLDDFGTGYSTLGYLKRMPIGSIKIDQSFVEGIPGDADSCAIVNAMLGVARHFKLKVVAEGIETAEQVEYLRSIGCDFAQGWFYARALPAQAVLEHVASRESARSGT